MEVGDAREERETKRNAPKKRQEKTKHHANLYTQQRTEAINQPTGERAPHRPNNDHQHAPSYMRSKQKCTTEKLFALFGSPNCALIKMQPIF